MREFFDVTLLAILQGVAEFLPISSSGHLVIGQHLLGMGSPSMRLNVFLHMGTLVAIFAYYRARMGALLAGLFGLRGDPMQRRSAWGYVGKIVLSAIPAILVYFPLRHPIDALFENARMVGALLMFTGAVLAGTRFLPRGNNAVCWWRAFFMGCGQAVALLPGVSRSGMTLASARTGRVDPAAAAEFSFLMSTPLIAGAAVLELLDSLAATDAAGEVGWGLVCYGAAVAAVVGYFSLAGLVRMLKGRFFWLFGPYCFVAGLLTLCFC